jgi:hypothetical protein
VKENQPTSLIALINLDDCPDKTADDDAPDISSEDSLNSTEEDIAAATAATMKELQGNLSEILTDPRGATTGWQRSWEEVLNNLYQRVSNKKGWCWRHGCWFGDEETGSVAAVVDAMLRDDGAD